MPLDNRSADGQSDPHAAALRRIEGIKELVQCSDGQRRYRCPAPSRARGRHSLARVLTSNCRGRSSTPIIASEALRSKIENDLLELDAIPGHLREILGELRLQNHALSLEITQRQRNHLPRGVVEIE